MAIFLRLLNLPAEDGMAVADFLCLREIHRFLKALGSLRNNIYHGGCGDMYMHPFRNGNHLDVLMFCRKGFNRRYPHERFQSERSMETGP